MEGSTRIIVTYLDLLSEDMAGVRNLSCTVGKPNVLNTVANIVQVV